MPEAALYDSLPAQARRCEYLLALEPNYSQTSGFGFSTLPA